MSATHKMVYVDDSGIVEKPIQVRQGEYLSLSTTGSLAGTAALEYSPDYTPLRPDAGEWLPVLDDEGVAVTYTAGAANPLPIEGMVGWFRLAPGNITGADGVVYADRGYRR